MLRYANDCPKCKIRNKCSEVIHNAIDKICNEEKNASINNSHQCSENFRVAGRGGEGKEGSCR